MHVTEKNLLQDSTIDYIVSDMPFNNKFREAGNLNLKKVVAEFYRVLKTKGKVVVLRRDKKMLDFFLEKKDIWRVVRVLPVNVGGIEAFVLVVDKVS